MHPLPTLVTDHLAEVRALCTRYGVKKLTLFGSAVKGTFDEERSDLDFAVEFLPNEDPLRRGECYWDLLQGLRDVFGRHVDLVSVTAIENPYFVQVLEMTQQPLYEAA